MKHSSRACLGKAGIGQLRQQQKCFSLSILTQLEGTEKSLLKKPTDSNIIHVLVTVAAHSQKNSRNCDLFVLV